MAGKYVEHILTQIKEAADDLLESDVQTAMRLHRLASNIAIAVIDNDSLIANLDVDDETKSRIALMVKEAVTSTRKQPKKVSKKIK